MQKKALLDVRGGRNLLWLQIEKLKSGKTATAVKEDQQEVEEVSYV